MILIKNGVLIGPSIKPGTWNIPAHPGTAKKYKKYEKNM